MAKLIAKNKDAYFNFELEEFFESGVQLKGWEVKSIRASRVTLNNAFCAFKNNELYVSGMHISQYMNLPGDETQPRKLLLHEKELNKIREYTRVKGQAVVAASLKWSSKGLVKLDIALGKGKTKYDKREVIKKRDTERMLKSGY